MKDEGMQRYDIDSSPGYPIARMVPDLDGDYVRYDDHISAYFELLNAVKAAYCKHHLGIDEVGWDELGVILRDAICNTIGDENFNSWLNYIKGVEE